LGSSVPIAFTRSAGGSEGFVKRLNLHGKLNGHGGCVNTIHFNPSGEILVSGSDDKQIIFWNWATKNKTLSYYSGHQDNVFQARIMPFTDDRSVITSASDGQVRFGQIADNGHVNTKRIGFHQGRVHRLAIEPGSPHIFYSCGEDGVVQHFDLRSQSASKLFTCTSFAESKSTVQLNVIVIDPRNPNYFAVGGVDEYARVYDIRRLQSDVSSSMGQPVNTFCPSHLIGSEDAHITGLAYSYTSELLVSYNDEVIYLFQKNMGIGPDPQSTSEESLHDRNKPQVYSGHRNSKTVKGVSFFGANDEFVANGSDCGHVYIWRKIGGELLRVLTGDKNIVNCIEPHPRFPFMATSGLEKNVKIWTPTAKKPIQLPSNISEIMESNQQGREERARMLQSPDIIMHVLRLRGHRTRTSIDRRHASSDHSSDEDDEGEAYVLGFGGSDIGHEDDDPRECNIS